MNVQQPMLSRMFGQRNLRKINSAQGRAVVAVSDQFLSDFRSDIFLRLCGAPADMRRQDHVVEIAQRRNKFLAGCFWLDRENVDSSSGHVATLQRLDQSIDVHHRSTRRIDEPRSEE